jgi:hypothetical protein
MQSRWGFDCLYQRVRQFDPLRESLNTGNYQSQRFAMQGAEMLAAQCVIAPVVE